MRAAAQQPEYTPAPQQPLPTCTATCIEYPGFVQPDSDACLGTLGASTGALQQTLRTKPDNMELKFRPADIMSHPIQGDWRADISMPPLSGS